MAEALVESNGGFPEPPAGLRVHVVNARHRACGSRTKVRLPESIPSTAVRRVVCGGCARSFEDPVLDEARSRLGLHTPAGRYLSVPLAAGAVVGALLLVQGHGQDEPSSSAAGTAVPAQSGGAASSESAGRSPDERAGGRTHLVRQSTFSLALPKGWLRTTPSAGATFAATAPGGAADVTLWVERDPALDFPTFEARSLEQLRQLAGSARIVDRVAAPTADATVVRLAADAPPRSPRYEVVLRVSGPYRYYLATTIQPDAPADVVRGVGLVQGSFVPEGAE